MAILEIKNINKSFGKTEVLKGVNFSMNEGDIVAVIGSSGSGKTTLLRCINFLETATKGQIFVDGKCIFDAESTKRLTSKEIRERQLNFGMVFQQFNLFPQYSALENVMIAPKLMAQERPDFKKPQKDFCSGLDWAKSLATIRASCREDSSSACQLRGHLRLNRASCSLTSRLQLSIRSLQEKFLEL